ncbi:hypothetical protein H8957_010261 [Semnopithecus entellus]
MKVVGLRAREYLLSDLVITLDTLLSDCWRAVLLTTSDAASFPQILVLFSGLRREEWRRAPSHCEWTVNGVPLHWFGFGYTALVVSGGIVGYVKTGRVPALAAGLLFGSLAGLGSYQLSQDPRNVWLFLAATSVTFVGVLGLRSYYYGKVMPVGLIAGASLLMAAKVGVRMLMTSD